MARVWLAGVLGGLAARDLRRGDRRRLGDRDERAVLELVWFPRQLYGSIDASRSSASSPSALWRRAFCAPQTARVAARV
jgi:hypothetical protein